MEPARTYSLAGLALTKRFEGCRLDAYQDSAGTWTIGYGHTRDVEPGITITQAQADRLLADDIANAAGCVNRLVTFPLTQPEFDAVTDLVFNIGCGNFSRSTMLRLINAGNVVDAVKQFQLWSHAGGKEVAGLLRRRLAEAQEFDDGA